MGKYQHKKTNVKIVKSRKEIRKEKRTQKKINKKNYFSQKKTKPGKFVKASKENDIIKNTRVEEDEEIESDFDINDNKKSNILNKEKEMKKPVQLDRFAEDQKRENKKMLDLKKKMQKQRMAQLKAANIEEDKVIKKLEKQLHIDKHRKPNTIPKMFNDGLDYALELCLPENIEKMYKAAKESSELKSSGDEFEEDFAFALSKEKPQEKFSNNNAFVKSKQNNSDLINKTKNNKSKKLKREYASEDEDSLKSENTDSQSNYDSELEIKSDEGKAIDSNNSNGSSSYNEIEMEPNKSEIDSENDDQNNDFGTEDNDNRLANNRILEKNTWEDIYGRKRDKKGNIIKEDTGKYVPPHVRARLEAESVKDTEQTQKQIQLRRKCKGFLNRLSEANVYKIASEIENLYMNNPRHDMNNALYDLITEALVSNVIAKERMVLEYSLLVAILHANVGSEVGAHFLQTLVIKFDKLIKNIRSIDVENKELDNTIFFIAHLYTFKIFQHSLIYELINALTTDLCEKSIECLLLILRSVGFSLRKDDPIALKEFIIELQKKTNDSPLEIKENPRLKFMLDIIYAIKNNNVNKIPQYDPSLSEHLKKILKSMLSNGKYISALNITMDDLLKVDERGKWWVVGSAWSGNVKDIGAAKNNDNDGKNSRNDKYSEKLLELARKQRMNTDDRRNVFCVLMSSEDYVDAFEKLLHLSIKDHRVIVSVVIHCCLSEKTFNPYYAVVMQKFCEYDRKYHLATQYALWDRIKDISSLNIIQTKNLSHILIYLITNGALPLSVLKVVEFGEIDKPTLRLMRQVMIGLLLAGELECRQIFERIAPSTKLNTFKDSLRLFMHHFLIKGSKKCGLPLEQMGLLKERIATAGKALETNSKVQF